MSQREVADVFGVSHASIYAIELKAMRKVKKILDEKGLTFDDLIGRL